MPGRVLHSPYGGEHASLVHARPELELGLSHPPRGYPQELAPVNYASDAAAKDAMSYD